MKKIIMALLLVLMVSVGLAQNTSQLPGSNAPTAERARLFKTYNPYTATSDDTTGFVTVNLPGWGSDPLLCSEVRLILVSTDSIAADIYVIGRNGTLTTPTVVYADSIVASDSLTTMNAGSRKIITLRSSATDRLAGCTQFKVGTVFRATGQGTTTGRTAKWYILYKYP